VIPSDAATAPEVENPRAAQLLAAPRAWRRRSMPDAVLCALWVGAYFIILLFFAMLKRLEGTFPRFKGRGGENMVERGETK
jgi:hypothetical protein